MWESSQQKQNIAYQCSFCKKKYDQANQLTEGPGNICICDECVGLYRRHLEERAGEPVEATKLIHICRSCGTRSPSSHHYCFNCGAQFAQET